MGSALQDGLGQHRAELRGLGLCTAEHLRALLLEEALQGLQRRLQAMT